MATVDPASARAADLPRRYRSAWRRSGSLGKAGLALVAVLGLALAGAFLFGAWHVVVGGAVKGNPRAAAFGVGLALVSGALLLGLGLGTSRALPEPKERAEV